MKKMETVRSNSKAYMDNQGNADPQILIALSTLFTPDKEILSEYMLEYLDQQLRRDQIVMEIYKNKFELANSTLEVRSDFTSFYQSAVTLKKSMLKIEEYQRENLIDLTLSKYDEFCGTLGYMLSLIYKRMEEGDQMKKLESYFVSLEDGEIFEDEDQDGYKDEF